MDDLISTFERDDKTNLEYVAGEMGHLSIALTREAEPSALKALRVVSKKIRARKRANN